MLLCLCGTAYEPADALDETCRPCKRLEAARAYAREYRKAYYHEVIKADRMLHERYKKYQREWQQARKRGAAV